MYTSFMMILAAFSAWFVCLSCSRRSVVKAFSVETVRRRSSTCSSPWTQLERTYPPLFSKLQSASCHREDEAHPTFLVEATSRRDFFGASTMAIGGGVTSTMMIGMTNPSPAFATAPPQSTIFTGKNLSIEDAKRRFQAARTDLQYLLEHYAEISKSGGGDAVRNYLGTQGVNSNLYGIQKVLKVLAEASDDIVEYSEAMEEFNAYYFQAEGAAYQSLFAEHSSAKATPESCLATAKQDIVQMQKFMDQLAQQLSL